MVGWILIHSISYVRFLDGSLSRHVPAKDFVTSADIEIG